MTRRKIREGVERIRTAPLRGDTLVREIPKMNAAS